MRPISANTQKIVEPYIFKIVYKVSISFYKELKITYKRTFSLMMRLVSLCKKEQ
jgi:hypothetical protein